MLCFAPRTVGWPDGIAPLVRLRVNDTTGLHRLLADGPAAVFATQLVALVPCGALGPLGLIAALRFVAWAHPVRCEALRVRIVAGPARLGVVLLAARLGAGAKISGARSAVAFDFRSGPVRLSALPGLGAMQLLCRGPRDASSSLARAR